MIDLDTVIEGLERCKPAWFTVCNCTCNGECPYNKFGHNEGGCVDHLIDDALALLKEQGEKIAIMRMVFGSDVNVVGEIVRCKDCKHISAETYNAYGNPNDKRYDCQKHDIGVRPDWFCADGERRNDDA